MKHSDEEFDNTQPEDERGDGAHPEDKVDTGRYTFRSTPPPSENAQRRSRWAELFEECREDPGEWRQVMDPLKKSTASQIASDVRNVHKRDPQSARLRGLKRNEQWDALWARDPTEKTKNGGRDHFVWLKYLGPTNGAAE